MLVMDVSAAIGICRGSDEDGVVESFLDAQDKIIAPAFFRVEAAQVAWKFVHLGIDSEQEARLLTQATFNCVDEFVDDGDLLLEALRDSVRLDHSVYDMLYFELAKRTYSRLLTCDKRLAKLCRENDVECIELIDV